jgi:hypothetical protein
MSQDYVPIDLDILKSRKMTTGVQSTMIEFAGRTWNFVDLGGQRSERKKWSRCFENVNAIMFVASLSAYDQVLIEDNTKVSSILIQNRLEEAVELFYACLESEWFKQSVFILFLNKKDIFGSKLQESPLGLKYPDYTGGSDQMAARKFILDMFMSKNKTLKRKVYPYYTCATDSSNILLVIRSVNAAIVDRFLQKYL